jgi:hypothetical protein
MYDRSDLLLRRGEALGCAVVFVAFVALVVVVFTNPFERVRARVLPPGTPVPVAELDPIGVPARGPSFAASTSLDALRQTVLHHEPCPVRPAYARVGCWAAVRVPPGTLLVAAVPPQCGNREWYGWTNGSTLTIDLVTWGCLLGPPGMPAEASYALLGCRSAVCPMAACW